MRVTLALLAIVSVLWLAVGTPSLPGASSASKPHAVAAKKRNCKTVIKKVHGHKKKIVVCKKRKKKKPIPRPTATRTPTPAPRAAATATPAPEEQTCDSATSSAPIYSGPAGVHTLFWLAGLYPNTMMSELDRFEQYHINGFLFDHVYKGTHDDFLNGGVGRLQGDSARQFCADTRKIVKKAADKGITDIYMRILADVLVRSHPATSRYKVDIFNQTEIDWLRQTFTNEAAFARSVGMKGIWIDAEPYDYTNYWREEQDSTMPAASKTPDQVANQYFLLGQTAEQAMLSVYPNIQVILSPAFGYEGSGPSSNYEYYGWFYAGMVSVAAQQNAKGFVLATEASYGQQAGASFQGIYNYEEGTDKIGVHNGVAIYTNAKAALQSYDAGHGTQLWAWHLAHSTVALSTWPYKNDGSLRFPSLDAWGQVVQAERSISPKYTWVYDENGQWLKSSYTCSWKGQTTTGALACPGLVLRDTLPAPAASAS